MKKICLHFRRWNKWRKRNGNSKLHKLFVLLGIVHSPTFYTVWLPEDLENISPIKEILNMRAALDPSFKKRWEDGHYPELNKYLQEPLSYVSDCNTCAYLNYTEAEQEMIYGHEHRGVKHICQVYHCRVTHNTQIKYHPDTINPCARCVNDNYQAFLPRMKNQSIVSES